ncbi:MAG: RluA family pseudouridine synthase [Clostridia bacterium]|nr:RluA family pseudouridine synthase [Clostridia bacterium]
MSELRIVYKDKDVVIIEKPVGMPSQSDTTGDIDAMSATSELLLASGENSTLFLIHRLDRVVGGLIAFARNKRAAAELSRTVSEGEMKKLYFAICHGKIAEPCELRDFLYKDSAAGKAYVISTDRRGAKEARLTHTPLAYSEADATLLSVSLATGRFHQIRVQLSSRAHPLIGDKKYGSRDARTRTPALFAHKLEFTLFGREISVSATPDITAYPWNLFDEEKYRS